jgi:hypothetical protein
VTESQHARTVDRREELRRVLLHGLLQFLQRRLVWVSNGRRLCVRLRGRVRRRVHQLSLAPSVRDVRAGLRLLDVALLFRWHQGWAVRAVWREFYNE